MSNTLQSAQERYRRLYLQLDQVDRELAALTAQRKDIQAAVTKMEKGAEDLGITLDKPPIFDPPKQVTPAERPDPADLRKVEETPSEKAHQWGEKPQPVEYIHTQIPSTATFPKEASPPSAATPERKKRPNPYLQGLILLQYICENFTPGMTVDPVALGKTLNRRWDSVNSALLASIWLDFQNTGAGKILLFKGFRDPMPSEGRNPAAHAITLRARQQLGAVKLPDTEPEPEPEPEVTVPDPENFPLPVLPPFRAAPDPVPAPEPKKRKRPSYCATLISLARREGPNGFIRVEELAQLAGGTTRGAQDECVRSPYLLLEEVRLGVWRVLGLKPNAPTPKRGLQLKLDLAAIAQWSDTPTA